MKHLFIIMILALTVLSGCITTRNGNNAENVFPSGTAFSKKKVAILPVKSQSSITTDSHTPLKKALNKKIAEVIKLKLPNAVVTDSQKNLDNLINSGKTELFDKLLAGYENTGSFDKKLIDLLCRELKSDYLLLPKLKFEQADFSIMGKGFSGSLEVFFLDKRASAPSWSGIGDFKRMGSLGLGGTETDEAADELVTLTFGESTSDATSKVTSNESVAEPAVEDAPLPVAKPVDKIPESVATPQSTITTPESMIVTGNKAKIRKKPSTKADIVKNIKKGEVVQVIKQSDEWFQIELASGDVGWCHKSVLERRN